MLEVYVTHALAVRRFQSMLVGLSLRIYLYFFVVFEFLLASCKLFETCKHFVRTPAVVDCIRSVPVRAQSSTNRLVSPLLPHNSKEAKSS